MLIAAFYDFVVDLSERIGMIKILDPVENVMKNGGKLEVFEPLPLQLAGGGKFHFYDFLKQFFLSIRSPSFPGPGCSIFPG